MRHLHAAIERAEALTRTGFPKPPTVLPHVHHAFARLMGGVDIVEKQEELVPFLRKCKERGLSRLRRSDLNRVLRGAWCDEEFDELGLAVVDIALGDPRSSSSRALVDGYLLYFPHERPVIHRLADACAQLVSAQEGPWRDRAERYSLFDPDVAAEKLGSEMANNGAFAEVSVDAGLGGSPFATRIGQSAFSAACHNIASMSAEEAENAQANLLDLLEAEERSHDNSAVARALLEPWITQRPPEDHRKRIAGFLVDVIGDPRLNPAKWEGIKARLSEACGLERARAIIDVLRRWLTEAAMRTFFRAIGKTTDRKDQWRTREQFWLAYLDAGLVTDAWPALGPRAKDQIRLVARAEGERLEHGVTTNGPPASSSLIMRIGDLVIAEWSDNGRCRFWPDNPDSAPQPYNREYDNGLLRTMRGEQGFQALTHDAGGNWRYRFARLIYSRTGIEHPAHGRGF
jgi:hypothetical protein